MPGCCELRMTGLPGGKTPGHDRMRKRPNLMPTKKKAPSKRELIEPTRGDKRFVQRKADGTFGKTVDVGKSLAADQKTKAKKTVPKG